MNYSLTYVGLIVALLTTLFQSFGMDADPTKIQEFAVLLVQIVGLIVAAFGRWREGGIKWYGAKIQE